MYYMAWKVDGRLNSYCTGSWDKLMARLVSLRRYAGILSPEGEYHD